ncbi:unnamed protein product [Cuscuta campestris]|uniref:Cytochrome P450 n=1 Tax=Cuscuta campestris TaxID=132261 RepID=A0A484JZX1_9ASTE|nr:unnamed protein product [Cuscuta campestris]
MKWRSAQRSQNKSVRNPTDWPVVRMLPAIVQNADRIHDYLTDLLVHNGGTFKLRGPWFANMHMLITCDPANVNHILCKNFKNYPKGPHFQRIFEVLGEGMINADSEVWELHRKTTMPLMSHPRFRSLLEKTVSRALDHGLFPILDKHAELGTPFGLKEVFRKLGFDIGCMQLLDKDPGSLSLDEDEGHPALEAIRAGLNSILYRHVLPEWCWKLQKWVFGVDREKRLSEAWECLDQFINPIIMERKQQQQQFGVNEDESNFSMLVSHIQAHQGKSVKFLRDTFVTLIIAGSDTTGSTLTWLFWLLAKNPNVEERILQEIRQQINPQEDDEGKKVIVGAEDCQRLIYLHAAVCESLRLFPSVPLNHKVSAGRDTLPSGHVVKPNTKTIMPFYSTGRMASVWGQDCSEFKPERWISPAGGIQHQPSFKFPAFNAGPRSCIGREMALTVVKMVAATLILHYRYVLAEPHRPVEISDSILLEMKHDLKVVFTRRR